MAGHSIHEALKVLAAQCDGAHQRDTAGFTSGDSGWANAWAEMPSLSKGQEVYAYSRLKKYSNQLARLGINYESIPDPARVTVVESDVPWSREVRANSPDRCSTCGYGIEDGQLIRYRRRSDRLGYERKHVRCGTNSDIQGARAASAQETARTGTDGPTPHPDRNRHATGTGAPRRATPPVQTGGGQTQRWDLAVEQVRESPDLREQILRSVMSSMEVDGFTTDRAESERLLDQALDGPPLVMPVTGSVPLSRMMAHPTRSLAARDYLEEQRTGPGQSDSILGPGGSLSRLLPGYEVRDGQLELARAIEAILTGDQAEHLVAEAPTGSGKSMAAMIPLALSGRRAIYSTAKKALQEQLDQKDVPFLKQEGVLPVPFDGVVLKGRQNYICRSRVERLEIEAGGGMGAFETVEATTQWPDLLAWVESTEDGDVEALPFTLDSGLRNQVTTDSDGCTGSKCKQYKTCFMELRKKRAAKANVVIVNHHLLMADLMVRSQTDGFARVLPDSDVIIIDESHSLEAVARDAFGKELTAGRWRRIEHGLSRLTWGNPNAIQPEMQANDTPERAEARAKRYLAAAENWKLLSEGIGSALDEVLMEILWRLGKQRPEEGGQPPSTLQLGDETPLMRPLLEGLAALEKTMSEALPPWLSGEEEQEQWAKLGGQVLKLLADAKAIAEPHENLVRYAEEKQGRKQSFVTLLAKPIDVSRELREQLWEAQRGGMQAEHEDGEVAPSNLNQVRVIAMSATLATDQGLGFWKKRVGCDDSLEVVVGSPFDYQRNALLYVPAAAERFDPRTERQPASAEAYRRAMADEIEALVKASGGRCFVLCTSRRAMTEYYNRLEPSLGLRYTVLRQGEYPLSETVRRFKEAERAVLFATKSFWEGVDITGEALSLVIIDKIPFFAKGDPVTDAILEDIKRRGGNWFGEMMLPSAIIELKQGVGRLIRTGQDTGVMAILDGRLSITSYGKSVVKALPPARYVRQRSDVEQWYGVQGRLL